MMPLKYTPKLIKEITTKLDEYIETTPIPIVAEFAYLNNIRRQRLYDLQDKTLRHLMARLIDKKEANLERQALNGTIDKSMAIFSLKQLGWKDRQEITGDKEKPISIRIITEVPGD